MFKAFQMDHPEEIELSGDRVLRLYGRGPFLRSLIGQKYAFKWEIKTRNEGLALMKEHHLFSDDFTTARKRYNGNYEYDCNEVYYTSTVYIIPAPPKPNGKPEPIRLWKPRGYLDWIADRVATIVDHWAGANTGIGWENWVSTINNPAKLLKLRSIVPKGVSYHELAHHYHKMFITQTAVPTWPFQPKTLEAGRFYANLKSLSWAVKNRDLLSDDIRLINHFRYTSKPELSWAKQMYQMQSGAYLSGYRATSQI